MLLLMFVILNAIISVLFHKMRQNWTLFDMVFLTSILVDLWFVERSFWIFISINRRINFLNGFFTVTCCHVNLSIKDFVHFLIFLWHLLYILLIYWMFVRQFNHETLMYKYFSVQKSRIFLISIYIWALPLWIRTLFVTISMVVLRYQLNDAKYLCFTMIVGVFMK